jgi:hypothetical protein
MTVDEGGDGAGVMAGMMAGMYNLINRGSYL